MTGSLAGIRVLDLTTIYSGPIAAAILGDQGADVIKVESPRGDFMRHPGAAQRNGVGGAFAMMNRNKRGVVIDLSLPDGKAVFHRLVEGADVVVENYRPGVMERLGIGCDTLRGINPKLVFASINGVGHRGPYAGRRVYDAVVQSISGFGSLQSDPAKERPVLINSLICDKVTSMTAAQAITSALLVRERTGVGQRVDIAMLDAALFFLWPDSMLNYTFVGDERPHDGFRSHANMVRATRDGHICTMPVQAAEWQGLFRALQLPDLFADERFRTQKGLDSKRFQQALNDAFASFDTEELAPRLEAEEVPFAKINPRDAVMHDPQVQAMQALWEFEHPVAGPMRQARPPARFSDTPARIFRCSPELGEHTREVLQEAGYSAQEVTDLRARNVVR